MRDKWGNYVTLKAITDNGPAWANGCPGCQQGIVIAPELTGAVPLYLERMVQALDKDIVFCECQAGTFYRTGLLNKWREVVEQSKRDARVKAHKSPTSEDTLTPANMLVIDSPIDVARAAIDAERARRAPVPTVHADGERVQP